MELCRQYGFVFICEILLALKCESYPPNVHCDPTTSYVYIYAYTYMYTQSSQAAFNILGKRTLMMLEEITKDKVNASFIPLSSM